MPVAGIVDVLDSYAFVRTSGYLPGPNDVYVSMGQVKKYGLRKGDAVHGSIRAPREGDRRNQRQKFVPLQAIDSINGQSVEEALNRPQFSKLTPLYITGIAIVAIATVAAVTTHELVIVVLLAVFGRFLALLRGQRGQDIVEVTHGFFGQNRQGRQGSAVRCR